MRSRLAFGLVIALIAAMPVGGQAAATDQQAPAVPGRYIVVFHDSVAHPANAATDLARGHGLRLVHVYEHAIKGFAAVVPDGRLAAIQRDPRVAFVEADREYSIAVQETPTGINRIEADKNPTADIDQGASPEPAFNKYVAIIDTGIYAHSDLNRAGRVDCTKSGCPAGGDDGNGHGTHVAGTVGAKDNSSGVVGVAPGTPLWAVKVCSNGGLCLTSHMIAGINWVAGRKAEANDGPGDDDAGINFAAANMSIGTSDNNTPCTQSSTDAMRNAVCGVVAQGVVFTLAAGNSGVLKVAYEAAIAVAAMADFNGKGGGGAAPTCRTDVDDTLANFSNYGPSIDIAAPGVCIKSTWKGGDYKTISGTSMAAPHVAGAVALYLQSNNLPPATDRAGVDVIRNAIIGAALPEGTSLTNPCSYNNERGSSEPLLFVNSTAFRGTGACDVGA